MYHVSQLIASANVNFLLKNDARTIVVDFLDNSFVDALLKQLPSSDFSATYELLLHFENITGNDLLPVIDVYLNPERENAPEEKNFVGSMALYGLGERSTPSKEHDGSGLHVILKAGRPFCEASRHLNWSAKQFRLTLVPASSLPADAILKIGRVALYCCGK